MDISLQGIDIGIFSLRFYSLMILLGLFVGIVVGQIQAKLYKQDPTHVVNIAMLGTVLGIIGARLYHVFDQQEWPRYRENLGDIFAIWNGGIGIFGAFVGAVFALWLYTRLETKPKKFSTMPFSLPMIVRRRPAMSAILWLDIGAPTFMIGQAIGRWGNFFNQELFGRPTDLPWGIFIPQAKVAYQASEYIGFERFHPLFFYESALNFLGVIFILYVTRKIPHKVNTGDILSFYLIWYPIVRFSLEFLRIGPWEEAGIPMSQIVSVLMFALGLGSFLYRRLKPPQILTAAPEETATKSRSSARRLRRRT